MTSPRRRRASGSWRARRVGGQRLGQPRRRAEALGAEADRQPLVHEHRQRGAPAVADAADHRVGVEADVVEEDLVELGLAGDLAQAADGDPRRVHRHDEHRQALVLGDVGVGPRQQQAERGELGVGGPHLLAVERPAAVIALARAGLHRGQVRAGVGLGEHLAPHLVAVEHRAEVAALLLLGAVGDQARPEHPDADHVEDPGDLGARDLLVDGHLLDGAETPAAELLGPRDRRPARPRRACAARRAGSRCRPGPRRIPSGAAPGPGWPRARPAPGRDTRPAPGCRSGPRRLLGQVVVGGQLIGRSASAAPTVRLGCQRNGGKKASAPQASGRPRRLYDNANQGRSCARSGTDADGRRRTASD